MSGATFQMLLASGSKAYLTYIGATGYVTLSSATSHTFNVDCGVGGTIALAMCIFTTGSITSVTIGGQTATIRVSKANNLGFVTAIATATNVPSGVQSCTVVSSVVWLNYSVFSYTLTGASSLTPTSTGSAGNAVGAPSGTLSNPKDGCTLGVTLASNGTTPVNWTGLTKDDDAGSGTNSSGSAHQNFTSANASLAYSVSYGGSQNQNAVCWASWGP